MSDDKYHVGQVLYVIPHKKALVVPICILERRTSETLDGVVTQFMVKGPKPTAQPRDLNSIEGMIFTSIEEVRETMLRNSQRAIDGMIETATKAAHKAFGARNSSTPQHHTPPPLPIGDDDLFDEDLDEAPVPHPTTQQKLQRVNGSHPEVIPGDQMIEVRDADGKMRRVKLET